MKKETKLCNKEFTLSGLKKDIEKMEQIIWKHQNIRTHIKEIWGTIGETEHESIMFKMFGSPIPLSNEQEYQRELNEILSSNEYTIDTFPFLKLTELFLKYIPIEDKRLTKQEEQERNERIQENEKKRQEERKTQEEQINLGSDEMIQKEDNQMFICISAYYDDSDMMTDYFHPHALLSFDYVLAVVGKQPEKERLARSFIDRIPELKKLAWKWDTQNYSMGHGNFLESETVGTIKHGAYNGRNEVNYWYEVTFEKYTKEMRKSKWYENKTTQATSTLGEKPILKVNTEKQGIEIYFNNKPEIEVLETLKSNGFRWSFSNNCWYIRNEERNSNYISNIKQYLNL